MEASEDVQHILRDMLGYLNFSAGKPDDKFQKHVSDMYRRLSTDRPWAELDRRLREMLAEVHGTVAAFRDVSQAQAALSVVFEHLLPAYRRYHQDLLFHQSDVDLFQPFLLARMFEAVLTEGAPWSEVDRIVRGAIRGLNDFVGYRPVAVLERKKCEPYEHEWVRPIPLYIRGAGVAVGKYHDIVRQALEILAQTDPAILAEAHFHVDLLDELAVDPRAYDFAHPVNQRPNYQFGEWDPHCLDSQGRYRRFVVRAVTLEALLERVQGSGFRVQQVEGQEEREIDTKNAANPLLSSPDTEGAPSTDAEPRTLNPEPFAEPRTLNPEPYLFEVAAVLAGTMLMASGTSGSGPDTHDSSVTLATLVPKIASYRDRFYSRLLESVSGPHGAGLRQEASQLQQPFGGARQHLNESLARRRAEQMQQAHLARLFAEMGYPEASREQSRVGATASVRIITELECQSTASHLRLDRGDLVQAVGAADPLADLLARGIDCGALVDPWNILGFQGQFSIFAALENTVPDPRVDQLTELIEQIFGLYARLQAGAAAAGDAATENRIAERFQKFAAWWDRFATAEIAGVPHVKGQESSQAATHVAQAMAAWRRAGEAAGDIRFWREHSGGFSSPRAFAQVVHALLEKRDYVAAMALLMSWLSQAHDVPLESEQHSFYELARDWLRGVLSDRAGSLDQWALLRKFFDYLEANAQEYWLVPSLELGMNVGDVEAATSGEDHGAGSDEVYAAAYEGVTYRDSAADGHDGELLEGGSATREFELEAVADRIEPRLRFLTMLATLWQLAADHSLRVHLLALGESLTIEGPGPSPQPSHPEQAAGIGERTAVLQAWLRQLSRNQKDLARLLDEVQRVPMPKPLGSHDSLVEHDRRLSIRERLTYLVTEAQVESASAARKLLCSLPSPPEDTPLAAWERHAIELERALSRGHTDTARALLPLLLEELVQVPLLYRRLDRGGNAREIVAARCVQHTLLALLDQLPSAGLLRETYRVLETAREMENAHPVGGEGITEFDRLFRTALRSVIVAVLDASLDWTPYEQADRPLLECLEALTEPFMKLWIEHSQSLRLSVFDRLRTDAEWQELRRFIEAYGHDLLTPKFLTLANLRALLDHGVGPYLDYVTQNADPLHPIQLIEDLDRSIGRTDAQRRLELVVQVFIENYDEYVDYNTTTAQSDYGERFFILFEFLRLKGWYDRISWNLRPVRIVHEALASKGRTEAAHLWHDAVGEKTASTARTLLQKLAELERQFGVRVTSVRDKLAERFVRPLALDRIRILIEPAIEEARCRDPTGSRMIFQQFQSELRQYAETTTGSGLEGPDWLRTLDVEVKRVLEDLGCDGARQVGTRQRPRFSRAHVKQQLEDWDQRLN